MFALNTNPIEGHPGTDDHAQHPTPVRLRCTCGSCPACGSTAAWPLIVTPSAGEARPAAGAAGIADTRQQAEHQPANDSGAGVNDTGAPASTAPVADQVPVTTMRTQECPNVAAGRLGDVAERASRRVSHAVMTAAVTKFEEIAGPMPLGQATAEVVRAFVDGLRREGRSEHTVQRYLGAMKAVTQLLGTFEQCSDAGKNPFAEAADSLHRLAPSRRQAPPVALDKLQTLLSSPRYLAKRGAVEPLGAAQFWVPLLCLFTYARPKELMQLQVSDLEPHKDAWVLISIQK